MAQVYSVLYSFWSPPPEPVIASGKKSPSETKGWPYFEDKFQLETNAYQGSIYCFNLSFEAGHIQHIQTHS